MLIVAAVLLAQAHYPIGAIFPGASIAEGPKQSISEDSTSGQRECVVRYKVRTAAPIADVAEFYKTEANANGELLFDDTVSKFTDYRTLTFLKPKFLFVVLSRNDAFTVASVAFKPSGDCMKDGSSAERLP